MLQKYSLATLIAFPPLMLTSQYAFANPEEIILQLHYNGMATQHQSIILKENQSIYLSKQDIDLLSLKLPENVSAKRWQEVEYYSINKFYPKINYQIDPKDLILKLNIPGEYFQHQNLMTRTDDPLYSSSNDFGGFVNFDVVVNSIDNVHTSRGIYDFTVFSPYGALTSEHLLNIANDENTFIRLNTSWQYERPDKLQQIIVGDSVTTPGSWGGANLYGGIKIRSNFDAEPNFSPFVTQIAEGLTTLPSTVELYLNNVKLFQQQVEPGPFDINFNPPSVGYNQVTVVTSDILGRQQVIQLPFYASSRLLKPGLHQYSFEAGFLRSNFGLVDSDYEDLIFTATDRIGVTSYYTTLLHAEVMHDLVAFGTSNYLGAGTLGIAEVTVAGSHSQNQAGGLFSLGFEHSSPTMSTGFQVEARTQNFRTIGFTGDAQETRWRYQANFAVPTESYGNVSVSLIHQVKRDGENQSVVNFNYAKILFANWSFNANVLIDLKDSEQNRIFFTFTRAFYDNTTSTVSFSTSQEDYNGAINYHKNPPLDKGLGYRFNAQKQKSASQYNGSFTYRNRFGEYTAELNRQEDNENNYRLNWQGGVVYINDTFSFSRNIEDSFILVHTPELSNLNIYLNHQKAAVSNSKGYALLSQISSFSPNIVYVAGEELPLNAYAGSLRHEITVLPKHGRYLKFNIHPAKGALITVVDKQGKVLPAGAEISSDLNDTYQFTVAYGGETYVHHLQDGENHFTAKYFNKTCNLTINYQPTDEIIPELGKIVCK